MKKQKTNCTICGRPTGRVKYSQGKCQGCYRYFSSGGIIHIKPSYGEVTYDNQGKLICHICGRSYTKLGAHIKESHNMTRYDYCKLFGLNTNKGLCSIEHQKKLAELIKSEVIPNLIEKGKNTRFTKGRKGRTRDQISAQNMKALIERGKLAIFARKTKNK